MGAVASHFGGPGRVDLVPREDAAPFGPLVVEPGHRAGALPLSAGQVVALRLADGKQVLQTFLSGSDDQANGVLGNMVLSGGLLLSLGPAGLTGFEQQAALTQRIAAAEKQEGRSGWASIKKAELALLSRDHATALERLRKVVDSKLDTALKARWRRRNGGMPHILGGRLACDGVTMLSICRALILIFPAGLKSECLLVDGCWITSVLR